MMRRMMLVILGLLIGVFGVWTISAQSGPVGRDPLPLTFPEDGAGWMNLSQEQLVLLLQMPGGIQDFATKVGTQAWEEFQREAGPEWERLTAQAGTAWEATLTRVVTVVLGGILLWWPHRFYALSWFFVGLVVGVFLVQTSAADAFLAEVFSGEPELRAGIIGAVLGVGLIGLLSGISLGLGFFVLALVAGWLAGALLGADFLNNGVFDLNSPLVFAPGIVFSILTAVAVGRSGKLIACLIGAAMVVAALRLSPPLIPVIGIAALIVSLARTKYAKSFRREQLDSLNLSEGKVTLEGNKGRKHLHGTTPEMRDDSNNSPVKSL